MELIMLQNDLDRNYNGTVMVYASVGCAGIDIHDEDGTYLETLNDEQDVRYAYGV